MMETPSQLLEYRLVEIQSYLDFLDALDSQIKTGSPKVGNTVVTTQQQRILYSSVYLQLYSLTEATINRCMNAVTLAATTGGKWTPPDFTTELRKEWIRVTARTHTDLNYDNRLKSVLELFVSISSRQPAQSFDIEKGGGGNWTDGEIEDISKRLGVKLSIKKLTKEAVKRPFKEDKGALALAKHLRNKLAHGEISFAECGEGATTVELRELTQKTVAYLRDVVSSFQSYIDSHGFLEPSKRPAVA